jgi:hypothetical protein
MVPVEVLEELISKRAASQGHMEDPTAPLPDRSPGPPARRGRGDTVLPQRSGGHPIPLARQQHPDTVDPPREAHRSDPNDITRGAPDARRRARPVRRAGQGNGPRAIPTPRPGSTPTPSTSVNVPAAPPPGRNEDTLTPANFVKPALRA